MRGWGVRVPGLGLQGFGFRVQGVELRFRVWTLPNCPVPERSVVNDGVSANHQDFMISADRIVFVPVDASSRVRRAEAEGE